MTLEDVIRLSKNFIENLKQDLTALGSVWSSFRLSKLTRRRVKADDLLQRLRIDVLRFDEVPGSLNTEHAASLAHPIDDHPLAGFTAEGRFEQGGSD
jgi:hypothetical protein